MSEPISKEEHYSVRWTSHSNNLIHMFTEHRTQDRLADVTLVCEGQFIKAHKIILSSCSTYFQEMFKTHGGMCGSIIHPFIIFTGEKFQYLTQLIQFMYQGEIKVSESDLEGVLAMGEKFQVKGLCSVRVKNKVDKPKSDNVDIRKSQPSVPPATLHMAKSASPVTQNVLTPVVVQNLGQTKQTSSPNVPFVDFTPKPPLIPIPAHQVPLLKPINHLNDQGKVYLPKLLPAPSTSTSVVATAKTVDGSVDAKRKIGVHKPTPANQKEPTSKVLIHSNTPQPVRKKIRTDASVMPASLVKDSSYEPNRVATPPELPPTPADTILDIKPQKSLLKIRVKEDLGILIKDRPKEDDKKSQDKQQPKSGSPFMVFASEWRKKLQVEHPGESNKEISVRLGNLWKNLSEETKQSYYKSAQLEYNSSTQTTLGKKVMQRRKTCDSSLNWKSNKDEESIEIIDVDRNLLTEK